MKYSIKKPKMIILVPYPAQGHVTPMLKLATTFLTRGFQPVIVTPETIHRQILSPGIKANDKILFMPIPDGMDERTPRDFFTIEAAMENNMPRHLERLVVELEEDGEVVCMVIDLLASWAIGVANRCGVPAAGFWPAMLATYRLISAIPDMVRAGLISETGLPQHLGMVSFLPNQPPLSTEELPWLIGTLAARKARFKFWTRTLSRSRTLQWLLVNSFPEEYYIEDDEKQSQLLKSSNNGDGHHLPLALPIGPLCNHSSDTINPSFWEEDMSSIEWLDHQKPGSAIYVSFGSWVSPIGEAKVKSLAMALEALGKPFLWVLRDSWRSGLPIGYLERVSKQGKVVSWAPQMEVLKHKAVGCYLTHCGWNSTMEAIQSQKRLLCYPIAGDQFLNCSYIVNVWKIGVEINGFGEKDVEDGVRKVMEDKQIGNRLRKMYERIMGDEACSRVMSNLTAFLDNVKDGIIHKCPINDMCS
ncbi:UDP-glycosyltransferase 82A1 [Ziziphus jujuba]|uniref:Glycosyltransferase n=2 Tax=Ziziphus jujuba TaxID=326968 RepID=A0ABM3IF35_ZIZJJ|nr:UDP-glycosyltransferase 82A1 [Ziziphus jujuba]KAH7533602.1 hypothetical protein FEM48_Zijuj04G0149200 [Ziziphus jujuba var. spinosa]